MDDKIPGPVLLGFGDFFVGRAAPRPPGRPPAKKAAARAGRLPSGRPRGRGIPRAAHKAIERSAADAAKQALAAGQAAIAKAKGFDTSKHVALQGTILLGLSKAPLTPQQRKATERLNAALTKHAKAAAESAKKGKAALDAAKKVAAARTKHVSSIVTSAKRRPKTVMHGAPLVGAAAPDPDNPGYLADGSLDPSYGADAGGGDVQTGTYASTGIGPEAERVVYQTVPPDGVVYDGSQGWPSNGFVSWNLVYGGGDGCGYTDQPPRWVPIRGGHWGDTIRRNSPGAAQASLKAGWGALIGNPKLEQNDPSHAWVKGLKYAVQDDKWFWLRDDAPSFATAVEDQAAAYAKAQADAAAQAAAEAAAAQAAQDQAAQEEAQARQDAENALAESKAASEANVANVQQQTQAQAAQVQSQQAAAQMQQAQSQAAMALAQFAQANPAAAFGPVPPGAPGGGRSLDVSSFVEEEEEEQAEGDAYDDESNIAAEFDEEA